ncbi:hypothetical protein Q4E93_16655 [Flavitalea sp. BT771]|uniref:hypothetical protein n=1 Tax=Flavitalea sp. BT771 TaxID=3063329 RepID=UPI0026E320D5|nr:hypothetical protein [Flavitalea sp. BT771]MDO6432234.1 hypothetical protein [Flavitalea sp. BT771]MDV6221144.1 hypothetical protein [Flavitalea sp. BT771]
MRRSANLVLSIALSILANPITAQKPFPGQPSHRDLPFRQLYSIKYKFDFPPSPNAHSPKISCDRNGVIQIAAPSGLLKPSGGALLHPGRLIPDPSYKYITDIHIRSIDVSDGQLVYLDGKAVFSNAWAGKLYIKHALPDAALFRCGPAFSFLVSDGRSLRYLRDSAVWTGDAGDKVIDILYDNRRSSFWILGEHSLSVFSTRDHTLRSHYKGNDFTCFALDSARQLIVGTHDGYFTLSADKVPAPANARPVIRRDLPATDLSVIRIIDGKTWFGSTAGAFMMQGNSQFDYYSSERWIPSDNVTDIAKGKNGSILLLTDKGLGIIHSSPMTLYDKATFFEEQVRTRHIRNGFNATISRMKEGNPDTGILEDSDNDGLWSAMYLGAEAFRYAVTRSPEALQNCRESLDAMERLFILTPVSGFPARSFERRGYASADTQVWRNAADPQWDWKSTTSSDEAIGHVFVYGVLAEVVDDPDIKARAIRLLDTLMGHIVEHDLYLVDWDGQPTKWGRWNPAYVNARPVMVGDRKITSSNILAMLQTAWHFTHKPVYRNKALELLNKYGYLDNLMRPMKDIGPAPDNADQLSKDLSDGWNHSDDEMYFLGYWGLYRYALNDTLKAKFKSAIIDHWQIERPEQEAAWNIATAITSVKSFDLPEAVNYLQRYPMDLVNWQVTNSHRKDLVHIAPNFRNQTITRVLPPDELPITRHNANRFTLDGGDNGTSEYSAGDIWLLPYWMGRYLGVISPPAH